MVCAESSEFAPTREVITLPSFIEIRPTVHNTIRTTAIRLDDDFEVTIRQEEPRKNPTHIQRNYFGLEEGSQISGDDVETPVEYVRVTKLDDDARCVIAVNVYHAADEADTVPAAGMYWYNTKTHSPFGQVADPGKMVAPDPAFPGSATQTFPMTIFNISSATELRDHPLPVGNTVAVSFTAQRLYARLGNLEARRAHLKSSLRAIMDHPDFAIWMANSEAHADITDTSDSGIGSTLQNIVNLIARPQSFVIWLQMMANVISLNANLNSERKFNLLVGELELGGRDVIANAQSASFGTAQIARSDVRNNVAAWSFHKFGDVSVGSPWTYTKPSAAMWPATTDTTIILTGAALGDNWIGWVRS